MYREKSITYFFIKSPLLTQAEILPMDEAIDAAHAAGLVDRPLRASGIGGGVQHGAMLCVSPTKRGFSPTRASGQGRT